MEITRGRKLMKAILTLLFLGIVYVVYQYIVYRYDPAKILKDHSMTTGTLIRFDERDENGQGNLLYEAMYVYEVNGKTYERPFVGASPCNYDTPEQLEEMLAHHYPVIYYNPDPEYSRLLVTPENFKQFEKTFPDSINGIYQKYWNCD